MKKLGYRESEESDHELNWESDALYMELHKRLVPTYDEDYYAYFGDGWDRARKKDGCCYEMSTEDEYIFLFTHFAKHFRDGGIGCRHVVDLWVYLRSHPALDEGYVRGELEKLRLVDFYDNILALLGLWFADGPGDEKAELITEFIFDSGSWGGAESKLLLVLCAKA